MTDSTFKGGHFAAVEQTQTLLKDLEDFIAQVWRANPGHDN